MKKVISISFLILSTFIFPVCSFAEGEVNLYSSRDEKLIKPLLDRFTQLSGITVNLTTLKASPLLDNLNDDGMESSADLLLTTDAGRLHKAYELDLLQPVVSVKLNTAIPHEFRHPEGYWYGLSVRARPLFYSKYRIKRSELSTYEALAEEKWKNRICIRSSENIYNQSLVASMIAHHGMDDTRTWIQNFVTNLARKPVGGDRDQIKATAEGICDIAIANTYYYGSMLNNEEDKKITDRVGIFWPNQKDRGVHVNISGIAMTKSAKNKKNAQTLMEFLVTQGSQNWYAQVNYEYPVIISAQWSSTLKEWGYFNFDPLNTSKLGEFNDSAIQLMKEANWE